MRKRLSKPKSTSTPRNTPSLPAASGPFPIVGIGASAGGLEAFRQLLQHLPGDTGMAFVLVQHLAPKHDSVLTELLSRSMKLPVTEVKQGMAVQPNHVYVIPPNTDMGILDGKLQLLPRGTTQGPHMPIDYFLRSLAADVGSRAIGVILSGTGSDGTLGVKAIKGEGGITFAQDEESAKYPGMPQSAVTSGAVDFVLSADGIAQELARIGQHPYINGSRAPENAESQIGGEEEIRSVFVLLRNLTGVNFGLYKPSTVKRRIRRRMVLHKIDKLKDYVTFLQENSNEVNALYEDMLIHVTGFFRDAETFEALKKSVFPSITSARKDQMPIRIWVPGCSTGEEVYSLAMALLEFLGAKASAYPIQFFATDISETSIERARSGIYVENITADVSPERIKRFFVKVEHGYQVSKTIREMCVFARHDVTKDPPFSKLDLISCRNLLIYLGPVLQKRVIPFFEYALKPGGFLLVGASEVISGAEEYFTLVDTKHRIYSRRQTPARHVVEFGAVDFSTEKIAKKEEETRAGFDAQKEVDRILLSRYVPAGVLVNEDLQIQQFRGKTGPFLEPSPGQASLSLTKMAREGLLVDLRSAIHKAKRDDSVVRKEGIEFRSNGRVRTVNIDVVPVKGPSPPDRYFLVLFEEATPPAPVETRKGKGALDSRAKKLEERELVKLRNELAQTKASLQSIIEEQETTNEELRSANEEILSSNEELQSTNEELETSKEELQSSNEELTTLNEEMQNRNVQLGVLNSDLTNLFSNVNIPIVMVGSDLRIRRFTPIAEHVLNINPGDIGRPIGNIRTDIGPLDLESLIHNAVETVSTQERDVQDRDGHWFSLRAQPYRIADNKVEGAVLTILDIDALKSEVTESRLYAESIVNTVRTPLMVLDSGLTVRTVNRAFSEVFQVAREDAVNRFVYDLGNRQWNIPKLRELLDGTLAGKGPFNDFEVDHDFPQIGRRTMLLNCRAIRHSEGRHQLILLAIEDITERKRAAEVLRHGQEMFEKLFESSPDAIVAVGADGRINRVNVRVEDLLGYKREELLGQMVEILVPDRFKKAHPAHRQRYLAEPRIRPMGAGLTLFARRKDGTEFPADILLSPLETSEGILSLAVIRDITARKRAEDEMRMLVEVTGVASEAEDVASMTTRCLAAISRYGHWQVAQAWVLDENEGVLRCDRESSYSTLENQGFRQTSLKTSLAEGVGFPGEVWKSRKAVWASDLKKKMAPLRLAEAVVSRLKSGFAFPIATADELIGVWEFYSTEERSPDSHFLEATESLGKHLALVYQRRRAEHSLELLTGRLINLQDDERRRIARDLHDSTSQSLAALSMNLAAVSEEAGALSPKAAKLLSDSAAILDQVGGEVRDVARLLHPPMLDEVGLASALQWLVQHSALEVKLDIPDNLERLPREIETALFRIVQEALSNVRRHARTNKASIQMTRTPNELTLEISDPGKGISPVARKGSTAGSLSSGLGIESMRQRVRQLGGQFDIMPSHPGTTLKVVLPLSTGKNETDSRAPGR